MSKLLKMVPEGARAVLSPDNNNIYLFWKLLLEPMKKGSFFRKISDFINSYPTFILFIHNQWKKLPSIPI